MNPNNTKIIRCVVAPLVMLSVSPALAQTEHSIRTFDADYFMQYAPQTAFDMVRRIPGFQARGGNRDRGLGQGGANVLVNGQQIVGKGGDSFDQIDRIPAANVVKIEILDGTSLEIPGLTGQVANIITGESTDFSGSWEWIPEFRNRQQPNLLRANVKVSGQSGDVAYSAELRNNARRNGDYGPETRRNADGSIYELRRFAGRYNSDVPGGSASLTWKPNDTHTGNLNLDFNLYNFHRNSTEHKAPIYTEGPNVGELGTELFNFGEDEWNAKIDGDYQFPFMAGKLKLIGYYRAEHSPTLARFLDYDRDARLIEQTEFEQVADEGEAIGRAEYGWSPKAGRDWQVSVEGAFNFLDIENQFFDILDPSNNGDLNQLEIKENRVEGFITHTRKISDKWSLQGSLGAEYSELTAGGFKRTFARPKGSLQATYTKDENFNMTARLERQVGQLNFFDFSSSISLQEDEGDRASNLDLVPSQNWFSEIALNKTFKGGHTIDIQAHGRLLTDIVDQIPFGTDDSAVGNIGSGETVGIHINTTLKGEDFGLAGMQLDTNVAWHTSSVTDPITLQKRKFSGSQYYELEVEFRHDIPNTDLAWGAEFFTFENASNYSPFVISRYDQHPGWNQIFVEHKDLLGLKVRAQLGSVIEVHDQYDRIIYSGRRDNSGIGRIENRRREYDGPYLVFNVSDTF
ncbi:MAG: TonB-dependent receptor plug domain-containing protein [Hellea sp.]|nr:TonB-dependent receptor plug domain-containing protein [Hellea sp.]